MNVDELIERYRILDEECRTSRRQAIEAFLRILADGELEELPEWIGRELGYCILAKGAYDRILEALPDDFELPGLSISWDPNIEKGRMLLIRKRELVPMAMRFGLGGFGKSEPKAEGGAS